ncbi:MAG: hypothetical protein QXV32_00005 [Conexivisphaerales archaeon]
MACLVLLAVYILSNELYNYGILPPPSDQYLWFMVPLSLIVLFVLPVALCVYFLSITNEMKKLKVALLAVFSFVPSGAFLYTYYIGGMIDVNIPYWLYELSFGLPALLSLLCGFFLVRVFLPDNNPS